MLKKTAGKVEFNIDNPESLAALLRLQTYVEENGIGGFPEIILTNGPQSKLSKIISPCFTNEQDDQYSLDILYKTIQEAREFALGVTLFEQIVERNPTDETIKIFLGCLYRTVKEFKKSQEIFEDIIELETNSENISLAFYNLATNAFLEKNYLAAKDKLQSAMFYNRDYDAPLHLLARIHIHQGNHEQALNCLNYAEQLQPDEHSRKELSTLWDLYDNATKQNPSQHQHELNL